MIGYYTRPSLVHCFILYNEELGHPTQYPSFCRKSRLLIVLNASRIGLSVRDN